MRCFVQKPDLTVLLSESALTQLESQYAKIPGPLRRCFLGGRNHGEFGIVHQDYTG